MIKLSKYCVINFGGDVGTLNIGQPGTTLLSSEVHSSEPSAQTVITLVVMFTWIVYQPAHATDVLALDSNKVIKNSLAGGQLAQGLTPNRLPTVSSDGGDGSDRAVDLYNVTGNGIGIFANKNESGNNYVLILPSHLFSMVCYWRPAKPSRYITASRCYILLRSIR